MHTKLLALCGALLLVVGCETTPKESADTSGSGAGAGTGSSVSQMNDNGGGTEMAAVEPAKTLQDILVEEVGDRVFFDYDRSVVRADGEETLQRQAAFLKAHPEITISVAGHCDERGTREYNLALGERRANATKNYLVSLGIDAGRISTISYGKERPIVLGRNEAAWAQNRAGVSHIDG